MCDINNKEENSLHENENTSSLSKNSPDFLQDPKALKREIEALMRDKFGDNIKVIAEPIDLDFSDDLIGLEELTTNDNDKNNDKNSSDDSNRCQKDELKKISKSINAIRNEKRKEEDKRQQEHFKKIIENFNFLPKDIKNYLDQYVIKQDDAKKALAIAVCDHYNQIKSSLESISNNELDYQNDNYCKQNVLILGPTGVGKTYLVRMIAKLIGVPFVKADATRFTEVGYVGANVEDMIRDLVSMSNGDTNLAQYGIIYFDEADKIAGHGGNHKDISGRGVQYGLLKLMEESEIDLKSPHDMISQMQAFMDMQRTGKVGKKVINTKNILFIISGAFFGLEDIIKKRLNKNAISLRPTESEETRKEFEDNIFQHATTKDFVDYGFEPEFIGRLPVRLSCNALSEDDLFHILKESKGSIVNQYINSFKSYGIDISFTDCALQAIAKEAHKETTGARGLMAICERIFRDYKFELPSTKITNLLVTEELVRHPKEHLTRILATN